MKHFISFLFLIFCFTSLTGQSENKLSFGLKAGLHTTNIETNQLEILEPGAINRLQVAVENAKYGFHIGLQLRAQLGKFLLQPEVVFSSSQVDYNLDGDLASNIVNEKYQYIDIPVLFGAKFGPLRLYAGPEGHVFLNSSSDILGLTEVDYRQEFEDITFGWQIGAGLDIWNLTLDFRHEGNFSKFGSHFNFAGQSYEFDDSPSRFLFSVGILF